MKGILLVAAPTKKSPPSARRGAGKDPFGVAMREAWESVKKDDFEKFSKAMRNALKIGADEPEGE